MYNDKWVNSLHIMKVGGATVEFMSKLARILSIA